MKEWKSENMMTAEQQLEAYELLKSVDILLHIHGWDIPAERGSLAMHIQRWLASVEQTVTSPSAPSSHPG